MNDIVNFYSNKPVMPDKLAQSLLADQAANPARKGVTGYLKLNKDSGVWTYGAECIDVEKESLWCVNPYTFKRGWVAWSDYKVTKQKVHKIGEVMGFLYEVPPRPDTDVSKEGGEWKEQVFMELLCISGEDEGEKVSYVSSALGGVERWAELRDEVRNQTAGRYPSHCFPVITLESDNYKSNYGSLVYKPVFQLKDWMNDKGERLSDLVNSVEDAVEEPQVLEAPVEDAEEAPLMRRPRRTRRI